MSIMVLLKLIEGLFSKELREELQMTLFRAIVYIFADSAVSNKKHSFMFCLFIYYQSNFNVSGKNLLLVCALVC